MNPPISRLQVVVSNDDRSLSSPTISKESVYPFRLTNYSIPVYSENNCYSDPLLFYLSSWREQFESVQKCYSDNYRKELPPSIFHPSLLEQYVCYVDFSIEILILIIQYTILEE